MLEVISASTWTAKLKPKTTTTIIMQTVNTNFSFNYTVKE
jgi:hypothetical protein